VRGERKGAIEPRDGLADHREGVQVLAFVAEVWPGPRWTKDGESAR
jgi:hypothetical protein